MIPERKCDSCGTLYGGLKRKSDECKGLLSKISETEEKITCNDSIPKCFEISQTTWHNAVNNSMGETKMVNSNSFENMEVIPDHMKARVIDEHKK